MQKKIKGRIKSGMKWISTARKKRGWTRYKLAQLLGKSIPMLTYLEDDGTKLDLKTLVDLVKIFRLSWDEFGALAEREVTERKKQK